MTDPQRYDLLLYLFQYIFLDNYREILLTEKHDDKNRRNEVLVMDNSSVKRTVRIPTDMVKKIEKIRKKKSDIYKSDNDVIIAAIADFDISPQDKYPAADLEYLFSQFEKYLKKSSYGINIRLNAREAAVDAQIIMEILNSILISTNGDLQFHGTYDESHEIIKSSKEAVIQKIEKAKQDRDFKKHE